MHGPAHILKKKHNVHNVQEIWGTLIAPRVGSGAKPQLKSELVHFIFSLKHLTSGGTSFDF